MVVSLLTRENLSFSRRINTCLESKRPCDSHLRLLTFAPKDYFGSQQGFCFILFFFFFTFHQSSPQKRRTVESAVTHAAWSSSKSHLACPILKYVLSLIWLSPELWVMHLPSYLQELVSKQDTSHFWGNITDLLLGVIFQVSGTLSNRPLDVIFSLLQGMRGPLIKLRSRLYLRFARNYYFCACLQSLFAADVWELTPYYSLNQLVFIHLFLFCFSMNWAHFKWILRIFLSRASRQKLMKDVRVFCWYLCFYERLAL